MLQINLNTIHNIRVRSLTDMTQIHHSKVNGLCHLIVRPTALSLSHDPSPLLYGDQIFSYFAAREIKQ